MESPQERSQALPPMLAAFVFLGLSMHFAKQRSASMWSLPDIQRRNAAAFTNREALENAVLTGVLHGERVACSDADENCRGLLKYELWFDIFSDHPKGIIGQCAHHRELSGVQTGYFRYERASTMLTSNRLCGAPHKRFNAESGFMQSPDSNPAILNQVEGFSLRITGEAFSMAIN